MIATIDRANVGAGMYRAALPDGGFMLIELIDAADLSVGHRLDVHDPTNMGGHRVRNLTTGETVQVYVQNYGRKTVGQHWFK